jgi:hypothetical protein
LEKENKDLNDYINLVNQQLTEKQEQVKQFELQLEELRNINSLPSINQDVNDKVGFISIFLSIWEKNANY